MLGILKTILDPILKLQKKTVILIWKTKSK